MHYRLPPYFTAADLPRLCDDIAERDSGLAGIINQYGYPPFWTRANTFETLVHIILEQQVSLASARAALEKLRLRVGTVTPEAVLGIDDDEFTGLFISRQKKRYIQELARAIQAGRLDLKSLEELPDAEVERQLVALKGIGNWTVSIYLILVLHRPNRFPFGDVAALSVLRQIKTLPKEAGVTDIETIVDGWRPYRTVAAMLLWHQYLSSRDRSY